MFKPVFQKIGVFDNGSILYGMCDVEDPRGMFMEVHISVLFKPGAGMVRFINHHTHEVISFEGTSKVSSQLGIGQYAYDVFYEKHKQHMLVSKTKKGVFFTDANHDGTTYKSFLLGPMRRAADEFEKEYGKDWLTF